MSAVVAHMTSATPRTAPQSPPPQGPSSPTGLFGPTITSLSGTTGPSSGATPRTARTGAASPPVPVSSRRSNQSPRPPVTSRVASRIQSQSPYLYGGTGLSGYPVRAGNVTARGRSRSPPTQRAVSSLNTAKPGSPTPASFLDKDKASDSTHHQEKTDEPLFGVPIKSSTNPPHTAARPRTRAASPVRAEGEIAIRSSSTAASYPTPSSPTSITGSQTARARQPSSPRDVPNTARARSKASPPPPPSTSSSNSRAQDSLPGLVNTKPTAADAQWHPASRAYSIGKTIGEGTFGKVKKGIHKLTGIPVAIKILEKSRIADMSDVERVEREIYILKRLRHPNVIRLYEVIDSPRYIFLIMEYANGGELFDFIVERQRVKESEAVMVFHHIVNGMDYCHRRQVIHRDLKPENLLLEKTAQFIATLDTHGIDRSPMDATYQNGAAVSVKIVDFGLGNVTAPGRLLKTACGSPCYAAPEMIAGKKYVGSAADIWSLGVILYAILCGYLPFEDASTAKLYDKIMGGKYELPDFLSREAKDLLTKILCTDPKKRYTAEQIRKHPWYTKVTCISDPPAGGSFNEEAENTLEIDSSILSHMAQIGFETDKVLDSLRYNRFDHSAATYFLFEAYKKQKLSQQPASSKPLTNPGEVRRPLPEPPVAKEESAAPTAPRSVAVTRVAPLTNPPVPPLPVDAVKSVMPSIAAAAVPKPGASITAPSSSSKTPAVTEPSLHLFESVVDSKAPFVRQVSGSADSSCSSECLSQSTASTAVSISSTTSSRLSAGPALSPLSHRSSPIEPSTAHSHRSSISEAVYSDSSSLPGSTNVSPTTVASESANSPTSSSSGSPPAAQTVSPPNLPTNAVRAISDSSVPASSQWTSHSLVDSVPNTTTLPSAPVPRLVPRPPPRKPLPPVPERPSVRPISGSQSKPVADSAPASEAKTAITSDAMNQSGSPSIPSANGTFKGRAARIHTVTAANGATAASVAAPANPAPASARAVPPPPPAGTTVAPSAANSGSAAPSTKAAPSSTVDNATGESNGDTVSRFRFRRALPQPPNGEKPSPPATTVSSIDTARSSMESARSSGKSQTSSDEKESLDDITCLLDSITSGRPDQDGLASAPLDNAKDLNNTEFDLLSLLGPAPSATALKPRPPPAKAPAAATGGFSRVLP